MTTVLRAYSYFSPRGVFVALVLLTSPFTYCQAGVVSAVYYTRNGHVESEAIGGVKVDGNLVRQDVSSGDPNSNETLVTGFNAPPEGYVEDSYSTPTTAVNDPSYAAYAVTSLKFYFFSGGDFGWFGAQAVQQAGASVYNRDINSGASASGQSYTVAQQQVELARPQSAIIQVAVSSSISGVTDGTPYLPTPGVKSIQYDSGGATLSAGFNPLVSVKPTYSTSPEIHTVLSAYMVVWSIDGVLPGLSSSRPLYDPKQSTSPGASAAVESPAASASFRVGAPGHPSNASVSLPLSSDYGSNGFIGLAAWHAYHLSSRENYVTSFSLPAEFTGILDGVTIRALGAEYFVRPGQTIDLRGLSPAGVSDLDIIGGDSGISTYQDSQSLFEFELGFQGSFSTTVDFAAVPEPSGLIQVLIGISALVTTRLISMKSIFRCV